MNRRHRVLLVIAIGAVAGVVAQLLDPHGDAGALAFLAAGVLLGELLVLRLEDSSSIPLAYAVLIVLASSFGVREYALAVVGAELGAVVLRAADHGRRRQLATFVERLVVAAGAYAAYRGAGAALGERETVAAVLAALAAAAVAQVVVDSPLRAALHVGFTFSPRGKLAWLAVASSGMLMAIGYHGVDGRGEVGIWGPLLYSIPLLAAWYAFERLDAATRSYRQTIEALAMAPELGGMVPAGHAERVATLAATMGAQLGLSIAARRDLEMAALLHHLGEVTLDAAAPPGQVSAVTGSMLREIGPLAAAGTIIAGSGEDPHHRLAVQVLRLASEYDDMTVRDHTPSDLALETLRSAPAYVYDARVVGALERALATRSSSSS